MGIQSSHNLRKPVVQEPHPYGVRVSLRANDPFTKILGPDWHREHWFSTGEQRDAALAEMSRKHEYSRKTDAPSLLFTKVEKLAESRGF